MAERSDDGKPEGVDAAAIVLQIDVVDSSPRRMDRPERFA